MIYLGVQEHPQTDLPLQSELISATVQSLDPTNVFSLAFLEGAKGKPHNINSMGVTSLASIGVSHPALDKDMLLPVLLNSTLP